MSLDFNVAVRQSFVSSFRAKDVSELLAGRLTMPPHPQWQLPATPTWREDPFSDRNWKFQYHMLRWLDPLRRAAAKGSDNAYEMWFHYLHDWVEKNPPEEPRSPWAWKDMSDGIRAQQLCVSAPLIRKRSPEHLEWLEIAIRTHAMHLADPENMGHSNHALHQQESLFVCGRILRDESLWQLALDRMSALLMEQYDEQGVNAEGAVAYHYNNYLWWEKALRRIDVEDLPRPSGAERLLLAPEEIAHATRPDGTLVSLGDTDHLSPKAVRTPITDYVTSGGQKGTPPEDVVKVYNAGYIFARSGWGETERDLADETFYSVSFGSSRRVHGHPDGGSLTYSADGLHWLVDPGKYQYGRSIPRDHFVSRAAHSVLSIDGRTPRQDAGVELRHREITPRHHDFLFDDDSFEGVTLSRRVVYSVRGEYLVVVDHVTSPKDVTGVQRWQLGPDVNTEISPHRVELTAGERRAALCFSGTRTELDEVRGQEEPFDGWVSTGWKEMLPATAVLARKSGTKFRFITVLAVGKNAHPTIATFPGVEPGQFCLKVDTGRVSEFILVGRSGISFPDAPPKAPQTPPATPAAPGTAPETKTADVRPTGSGRPHPEDASSRKELFALLAAAREDAWDTSARRREESADQIRLEADARGLETDLDLGTSAAIADLRQDDVRQPSKLVLPHRKALMNWDGTEGWQPTSYALPVVTHCDRFSTPARPSEQAIHTLPAGPLVLPIALDPVAGDTLTVLLHGAIDRARIRVPIFQRWRYQLELQAGPTVAISDPTLDLSSALGLGWYLGTERTDLFPIMAENIERIASALRVSRIILSGSSGGGFAAFQIASHLPEAIVVAMSPQTDLRRYPPRLTRAAAIPALGRRRLPTEGSLIKRLSVAERFRRARVPYPRTVMVSNLGDEHHRLEHELPLFEAFRAAGHEERMTMVELDLGEGHRALPNKEYGRILGDLYEDF